MNDGGNPSKRDEIEPALPAKNVTNGPLAGAGGALPPEAAPAAPGDAARKKAQEVHAKWIGSRGDGADDEELGDDEGRRKRHWYRRCMDHLETMLNEQSNPSEKMQELCERIVTGFLTAVTGQAPDSKHPQFPADRAYFIPFDGDRSETFNFSKPFYQFLPEQGDRGLPYEWSHSLWAFLPWNGQDQFSENRPEYELFIDSKRSVSDEGTGSFRDMIQVRDLFQERGDVGPERQAARLGPVSSYGLRKSLLIGINEDDPLGQLFRASNVVNFESLDVHRKVALVTIFKIYAANPGNAGIEHLLLNHLHVVHWLTQLARRRDDWRAGVKGERRDVLMLGAGDYANLADFFLRCYLLESDPTAAAPSARPEAGDESRLGRLAGQLLEDFRKQFQRDEWRDDESLEDLAASLLLAYPRRSAFLEAAWDFRAREYLEKGDARHEARKTDREFDNKSDEEKEAVCEALAAKKREELPRRFERDWRALREKLARLFDEGEAEAEKAASDGAGDEAAQAASVARFRELRRRCRLTTKPPADGEDRLAREGVSDAERKAFVELLAEVTAQLKRELPTLSRFCGKFLRPTAEARLDGDLSASLGDGFLRAGKADESFVWACPDFADLQESLPRRLRIKNRERTRRTQREVGKLVSALKNFAQMLDASCLGGGTYKELLEGYWSTLGLFDYPKKVFASSQFSQVGMACPEAVGLLNEAKKIQDPAPQNIFLRVRIVDTLNEPVINGLFVFTSDYDEAVYKGKRDWQRNDDVEDLLAFAKVYFFNFRDFLRGLDRAREAEQIGTLNQELYDKRLATLDEAMRRREETREFANLGISHRENWDKFLYELINGYANSLLEKKKEVAIETFGYERLVILPLSMTGGESDYDLAFYLFQALYLERDGGVVQGGYYSLLKPFRSPVEALDSTNRDESSRFRERSFQQVSHVEEREIPRARHLEKCYVGQEDPPSWEGKEDNPPPPHSMVPKLADKFVTTEGRPGRRDEESPPTDRGRDWANRVLDSMWATLADREGRACSGDDEKDARDPDVRRWHDFLENLTKEFRHVRDYEEGTNPDGEERGRHYWFWFRYALLRLLLSRPGERPPLFGVVRRKYEQTIKHRFDNDNDLNLLTHLEALSRTPLKLFSEVTRHLTKIHPSAKSGLERIAFEGRQLRGDPSWVDRSFELDFFERMTRCITNDPEIPADDRGRNETWYQPTLTRTLKGAQDAPSIHALAADKITVEKTPEKVVQRAPQYARIMKDEDSMHLQLAVVHFTVGETEKDVVSERDQQRISLLVALIRDYDPARAGTEGAAETARRGEETPDVVKRRRAEVAEQMQTDRKDLTLFTKTVFQNVNKFVTNAVRQQQLRVLTTDINQIARNWYTDGIDQVMDELQKKLEELIHADSRSLGSFRPEMLERYFEAVCTVLTRKEVNREGSVIKLESFPFDRLLHVSLMPTGWDAARLSYARTTLRKADKQSTAPAPWAGNGPELYQLVRDKGRVWSADGMVKELAYPARHLCAVKGACRWLFARDGKAPANGQPAGNELSAALDHVVSVEQFDRFVSRLYEAPELEALTLAGLIRHLLTSRGGGADGAAVERLSQVITDRIQGVERRRPAGVFTHPHFNLAVRFQPIARVRRQPGDARAARQEGTDAPVFFDFFRAIEEGAGQKPNDWTYGLLRPSEERGKEQPLSDSKVFYVYYSLPACESFGEDLGHDPRYRGLVCLIVDDTDTDVKNETSQLADREDLRTFVHNSMGGLRLVVDQQALHDELLRPATDQVGGMMHRLKTELYSPTRVVQETRRMIDEGKLNDLPKEPSESRPGLDVRTVDMALDNVNRFNNLFARLKKLSGNTPLETFDTVWLGWQFVAGLSTVVQNLSQLRAENLQEQLRQVKEIGRKAAEALKAWEVNQVKPGAEDHSRETPGEALRQLQEVLVAALAAEKRQVELLFRWGVASEAPIRFVGCDLLEEAVHILVENAFQAMWGYVNDPAKASERVVGLLSLFCHRDEERPEEMILEIRNSTMPIDSAIENVLTADVAAPLDKDTHEKHSGKKGGSGFGHYYARRVVSNFCGSKEFRRKLGVRYAPLEATPDLFRLRINLIEDPLKAPDTVSGKDLQDTIKKVFAAEKLTPVVKGVDTGRKYLFPSRTAKLAGLLQDSLEQMLAHVRELLLADRELQFTYLLNTLKEEVGGVPLKGPSRRLHQLLRGAADRLARKAPAGEQKVWRSVGNRLRYRVFEESVFTLCSWLHEGWHGDRDNLKRLFDEARGEAKGASKRLLEHAEAALTAGKADEKPSPFVLFGLIEPGPGGQSTFPPAPDSAADEVVLLPADRAVALLPADDAVADDVLVKDFGPKVRMLGRTIVRYRRWMCQLYGDDRPIGALWFERAMRPEESTPQQKEARKKADPFELYDKLRGVVRREAWKDQTWPLLRCLKGDKAGKPLADREEAGKLFAEPSWRCEVRFGGDHVVLAFRLGEGGTTASAPLSHRTVFLTLYAAPNVTA
jgi:hypothetical protein